MDDIRILNLRDALVLKHTFISNKASNSFGIQCFIKPFCFKYWYVDHLTRRRNNYVITNELKQYSEETNKIIKVLIVLTSKLSLKSVDKTFVAFQMEIDVFDWLFVRTSTCIRCFVQREIYL